MRAIDADALEREGWSLCRTFQKDECTMVYEVKKPSDFPAIEEHKTGKWIPVDSYSAFGGDEVMWEIHGNPIAFYYCSECKEHAYAGEDGESLLTTYCPNCGARLVQEGEDNE